MTRKDGSGPSPDRSTAPYLPAASIPSAYEQFDLMALLENRSKAYQAFLDFHHDNPSIYDRLVSLTRTWRAAKKGAGRLGFAALWERLRWDLDVETTTVAPKLNNNFRSYYARYIMLNEPDLAGIYEIRASPADRWLGVNTQGRRT
jgi:hypothetical protein